jgi:hypothetical protein
MILMPAAAAFQVHMNVFLARETQQLLDAFLAADAGLLLAAEGRAEEMFRYLVDPDIAGLDRRPGAMGIVRLLIQIFELIIVNELFLLGHGPPPGVEREPAHRQEQRSPPGFAR